MTERPSILLTGGTGFVGGAILNRLVDYDVTCLGRTIPSGFSGKFVRYELSAKEQLEECGEIDVIIHSAARAHIMNEEHSNSIELYRDVNTLGTLKLAKYAASHGVKRFIFMSSIKVNGELTQRGAPFRTNSNPNPKDAYGMSKLEAEVGLKKIAAETGMEVVIIRPPLVYGSGVKANFSAMMRLAEKNLPLPLGAIHNKRSLVALDNLVDLVVRCIEHPKATNQTFLVSDDRDVSTTQLLSMMIRAAGKKPRLFSVPISWLKIVGQLTGKSSVIDRLCGNLQLDIRHTKETLEWEPPVSMEEGIRKCFQKGI